MFNVKILNLFQCCPHQGSPEDLSSFLLLCHITIVAAAAAAGCVNICWRCELWMNIEEDHMVGSVANHTTLLQSNQWSHLSYHHSYSVLLLRPTDPRPLIQTLFKINVELFNLEKYIFLHLILFTLIMSASLWVILKQLFIPYCSFTPTYD